MTRKYAVIYEKGPESFGAHVPDLPGCVAAGESFEATESLIREAIELHLATLREDGMPVPEPVTTCDYVEAAISDEVRIPS